MDGTEVSVFPFWRVLTRFYARALADPPTENRALLETGANTVCKTKDRARDPLLVLALMPQVVRSALNLPTLSVGQRQADFRMEPR